MHPKVFISHAGEDREFVRKLTSALTAEGINVWLDENELKPGVAWKDEITNAIRESDFVIVVVSPSFAASDWSRHETASLLKHAAISDQRIIPLFHRTTAKEAAELSPMLALRVGISSDQPLDKLASAIRNAVVHADPSFQLGDDSRSFNVLVDPGTAPAELLTELYGALSAYYRSLGGSGLDIKKDERRSIVGELV